MFLLVYTATVSVYKANELLLLGAFNGASMDTTFLDHLHKETDALRSAGLYKAERVITSPQDAAIKVDGTGEGEREVLNFCANNYLGLANRIAQGRGCPWRFRVEYRHAVPILLQAQRATDADNADAYNRDIVLSSIRLHGCWRQGVLAISFFRLAT